MSERLCERAKTQIHFLTDEPYDKDLPALIVSLEAKLEPATGIELGKILDHVANVLDCPTPNERALETYYTALTRYPVWAVKDGCLELVLQYHYRKFPLVGDFIKYIEAQPRYRATKKCLGAAKALQWKLERKNRGFQSRSRD